MSLLQQALRGARHAPRAAAARARQAIVVGGGGALGSAVLEQALARRVFDHVRVLVDAPMAPAMRGLESLSRPALDSALPLHADTAFVVFDRERSVFGREDVFHRPSPQALPALAQALHRGGVIRLIVVLPHAPGLLPEALKRGLASLDEHAVAKIGFEHVVFVRPAQSAPTHAAGHRLQRLAHALLAQLRWMLPAGQQAVRADKVAAFVLQLAQGLPQAARGTRVAPPELIWVAAQDGDIAALVQQWLASGRVPVAGPLRSRW